MRPRISMRVCPSVGPSVRPSVGPLVGPSVTIFFSSVNFHRNHCNTSPSLKGTTITAQCPPPHPPPPPPLLLPPPPPFTSYTNLLPGRIVVPTETCFSRRTATIRHLVGFSTEPILNYDLMSFTIKTSFLFKRIFFLSSNQ